MFSNLVRKNKLKLARVMVKDGKRKEAKHHQGQLLVQHHLIHRTLSLRAQHKETVCGEDEIWFSLQSCVEVNNARGLQLVPSIYGFPRATITDPFLHMDRSARDKRKKWSKHEGDRPNLSYICRKQQIAFKNIFLKKIIIK